MQIVDINTGEVIEVFDMEGSNYYTTREHWADYKAACREYEKELDKFHTKLFLGDYSLEAKVDKNNIISGV